VQLGYVSLLALLSDWVCFSSAAAPDAWVELYGRAPEALVDASASFWAARKSPSRWPGSFELRGS